MKTFFKANVASLVASFCDYSITVASKEWLKIDPVWSTVIGTAFGGVINFMINRYWVFDRGKASALVHGKRYFIVWAGNLLLNAAGAYILINLLGVNYMIAKLITSLTVSLAYNYPLQKGYVFKNN